MAKTVYKYELPFNENVELTLPEGAEVLCVQTQLGRPWLWARIDPKKPAVSQRCFRIAGTGHPLDEADGKYIGTFQLQDGALIFHVFERE